MTAPSPLDPAAGGWHLMPRGWRASEVYRALRTAEARHVAELVLFDRPRFRDETCWFGGRPFVVRRGQLFDAEETIAELAGTSRKVVRTVLRTLITAGHIARVKVHPSGQCPHVITVRDYELSQTLPANGASGTAREGPEAGQRRAPSKPQEPQEPHEREKAPSPAKRGGLPTRDERHDAEHPRTAALLAELAAQGCPLGHAAGKSTRLNVELAIESAPAQVAERILTAWREKRRSTIGWYLDAIVGKLNDGQAPEAPTPAPALWERAIRAHEALPYEQRWNGIHEMRVRDDGAGGLVVLTESSARAEGLMAMGRAEWLSKLAGGAPVRIEARNS